MMRQERVCHAAAERPPANFPRWMLYQGGLVKRYPGIFRTDFLNFCGRSLGPKGLRRIHCKDTADGSTHSEAQELPLAQPSRAATLISRLDVSYAAFPVQ